MKLRMYSKTSHLKKTHSIQFFISLRPYDANNVIFDSVDFYLFCLLKKHKKKQQSDVKILPFVEYEIVKQIN